LRLAGLETQSDTGGDIALTASFTADRPAVEAVAGRIQFDRARVATANANIEQAEPTVLSLAGGVLDIDVL
jgi:predicted RecB family endonuclease